MGLLRELYSNDDIKARCQGVLHNQEKWRIKLGQHSAFIFVILLEKIKGPLPRHSQFAIRNSQLQIASELLLKLECDWLRWTTNRSHFVNEMAMGLNAFSRQPLVLYSTQTQLPLATGFKTKRSPLTQVVSCLQPYSLGNWMTHCLLGRQCGFLDW